jgi:antitoxin ParD1/3/4
MSISLPPPLREWVEAQVAAGGYDTVSQYLQQLLHAERQRQLRRQIDDNLHQALDSGESTPLTPEEWAKIRREGRKRLTPGERERQ